MSRHASMLIEIERIVHVLVAPSNRNSGYSKSDPDFPDILAGILYRSEGKNYKLGLSACRICTETDRNFRRCRNLLSMYRCNFVHTDITNSLLIENFERRNLFFVALYFMYHLYYSAMLNEFLH